VSSIVETRDRPQAFRIPNTTILHADVETLTIDRKIRAQRRSPVSAF
jgi:hypothetical protein